MRVKIRCIEGGRAGERFSFQKECIAIGRDPACDLALDSSIDDEASWRHAEIRVAADEVRIVDLGSTNGTYRNDEPVSDAPLEFGDRVRFGPSGPLVEVRFGTFLARLWKALFGRRRVSVFV